MRNLLGSGPGTEELLNLLLCLLLSDLVRCNTFEFRRVRSLVGRTAYPVPVLWSTTWRNGRATKTTMDVPKESSKSRLEVSPGKETPAMKV